MDLERGYLDWVVDGLCTTELLEITLGLFSGFLFNTADMHLFFLSGLLRRQKNWLKPVVRRRLMLRKLEGQILSLMLKILATS